MAGNSIAEIIEFGRKPQTPNADVIASIDELRKAITGDLGGVSSGNPISLGKKAVKDIRKGIKGFAAEDLPDLYTGYEKAVALGRMTRDEAATAFEAAARGAGSTGGIKKANQLRFMEQGLPEASTYNKYRPYFDITSQQLLGRPMGDQEYNAYVGALQGMGVTNPSDVAASFGKMLTTSDEYAARQYRFKPAGGLPTLNRGGSAIYDRMFS